ncbi:MAG: aspartate--tRNA(Asn) ligase [Candidatus Bathyarchaeia archaeon]
MNLDELGAWRRTHFASEIGPRLRGSRVVIFGWVHKIRDLGGLRFVILRDRTGRCQITIPKEQVNKELAMKAQALQTQYVVGVEGEVRESVSRFGADIVPSTIRILNTARHPLPLDVTGTIPAELDKRLDARVMDLRREGTRAIFRIRNVVLETFRDFLTHRGYIEVHTPRIIASATEGGAALFRVDYFGREAFLAQSPQLYKEELVSSFEKVYEIGPVFRAEESHTRLHTSEYTSIDVEEAFVTADDVMGVLEDAVIRVVSAVSHKCQQELKLLGHKLPDARGPLEVMTYDDVIAELRDAGTDVEWGEDLPTPALRVLGTLHDGFYFIRRWPTRSKPFYIQPVKENPKFCDAFDLMCGWVEVASGGTRVHQKQQLLQRLRQQGLDPRSFEYHLRTFDYGMPPHSGFAVGLERLLMCLTGCENIREVSLFPRDVERLTP